MAKLNTTLLRDLDVKTTIGEDDYVIVTSPSTKKMKIKDITKDIEKKAVVLEEKTAELGSQLDTKTNYYVTSSEFNAIGDCEDTSGVGTDNTIMFSKLLTQKNIRIPKGKFLITNTINITGNIIIEGSGIYETMLIFNNEDTMKSMFEKTDSSISFLTIKNITIKTLNNNKIFNLNSSCNIDFERVYLLGKNKQGIGIEIKEPDFVRI